MFHFSNNLEVILLPIENSIWGQFNFFQSASTTQQMLKTCYEHLELPQYEMKSYDNCYPFMYYLEQGQIFYQQAAVSPLSIKPILLFYGFVHLLKACLLTVDPLYPSTTSVLAHGVSARKRKKRQYQFFQDEVKIQKNGLCTHISEQMFHVKQLDGEKYKMGDLLRLVAELDNSFLFLKGTSNMIILEENSSIIQVPAKVTENYHMDNKRLKQYLDDKHRQPIPWIEADNTLLFKKMKWPEPPFRYQLFKQTICLPSMLHPNNQLPDILVHYLLLYNLSMIARYETEWWFELMKTTANTDYPFIKTFLETTQIKSPYLVWEYLTAQISG